MFFLWFPIPWMGFPGGTVVKKRPPANAGDTGHSVRSLGQEDLLEKEMATYCSISCLGNPIDRGASRATVHEVTKSWTQLSPHALEKCFPGSASGQEPACQPGQQKRRCFYPWVEKIPLEKEMATHSSILARRIPMDRRAWPLQSILLQTPDMTEVT